MTTNRQLPDSKHFALKQLAEGVYAAIHIDGGAAISNAGIVDLGDRTLIYDAFMTPQAAEDLRAAAEALIGRPIDAVIDSHWHSDHIWGNQVFGPETDILSAEETHRLINATHGQYAFDSFIANAEAKLEATRVQLETAKEESRRRELAHWMDYHRSVVEAKPVLRVRAPNLTFRERLAFYGTARSAELITFVGGHTESDAVLFLPQEGIAFMSDLLYIERHPYLGGSDPARLLHILEQVSALAPKVLVPGHGPVGTTESLAQTRQYVSTLDGMARRMVEEGEAEEAIDAMVVPEPYGDWLLAAFFPDNMHFLYQRRLRERGGLTA